MITNAVLLAVFALCCFFAWLHDTPDDDFAQTFYIEWD
jgi:hypothetical protein